MTKNSRIVITGAAGFIGSCLAGYLNTQGFEQLILVDEFNRLDKMSNLKEKESWVKIERDDFFDWLSTKKPKIDFVFHIGARTDTTEFDYAVHERLNVEYSPKIKRAAGENGWRADRGLDCVCSRAASRAFGRADRGSATAVS